MCSSGIVRQRPLLLLLALLVSCQCPCSALQPCVGGRGPVQALQSADCSWEWGPSPQPNAVTILGALGQTASIPPAIIAVKGTAGASGMSLLCRASISLPFQPSLHRADALFLCPGPTRLDLANVVLDGFTLPNPSSSPQALIPSGLLGKPAVGSRVSLSLQDVRILVDAVTLQQHAAFFSKLPDVTVYTVSGMFSCSPQAQQGMHPTHTALSQQQQSFNLGMYLGMYLIEQSSTYLRYTRLCSLTSAGHYKAVACLGTNHGLWHSSLAGQRNSHPTEHCLSV